MSEREETRGFIDSLLELGRVTASKLSGSLKNVLVTITGIEDADGGDETRTDQPLYGHAGVLVRPAAPSSDGAFEVVFVRHGEDLLPIAHRDTRWQVDLEEGEVVVRALGSSAARIHLRTDGTIRLVSSDASESAVLGDSQNSALDTFLDALRAWATLVKTGVVAGGGTLDNTIFEAALVQAKGDLDAALSGKVTLE